MKKPKLPTLGEEPKQAPWAKIIAGALACGAVAGGVYAWVQKHRSSEQSVRVVRIDLSQPAEGRAPVPPPSRPPHQEVAHGSEPQEGGLRSAEVKIEGPLERAVVDAVGPEVGPALAQVLTRTLVWWVSVPGDLKRGDRIQLLYESRPDEEPLLHAVRFQSEVLGRTAEAYLFQPSGQTYPRFYQPTGEELELRLVHPPLDDYEQVTSRLRDGRRHQGVDFKTPVGTLVRAPFSGTITRRNWNFRGNGNSLELTGTNGQHALFLHLDVLPKTAAVGRTVQCGEFLARSGNSGHSFAPHLHYQLMQQERAVDPFTVDKTLRKSLPPTAMESFAAHVASLRQKLGLDRQAQLKRPHS